MDAGRRRTIPVLLLKTKSVPTDSYEELFSSGTWQSLPSHDYQTHFVPVLEHKRNEANLSQLRALLQQGRLQKDYGGMIFTSQRAVETWTDVVREAADRQDRPDGSQNNDPFGNMLSLIPFPLYTVGPATSRALRSLTKKFPLHELSPEVLGEHTGNGGNLAQYILKHYNNVQAQKVFDYFEAPRLPFIPLLGMSSQNYGRKRLEREDDRLRKKPLLFLVGETRRDIIPTTLMSSNLTGEEKIEVIETEVYSTGVLESFAQDFENVNHHLDAEHKARRSSDVRVVVVFSPQGSRTMLEKIGLLDEQGKAIDRKQRKASSGVYFVVATIGPTTRDYLVDTFGLQPDVCASRPSPEGLRSSIEAYLAQEHQAF